MKLMIAEDDVTMQMLLVEHAKSFGYDIVTVENGKDALEVLLGADAPNLALLDWIMPEIDGVDVCRKIRQADLPIQPYLIMLTAQSNPEDLAIALDAGADDFIVKPYASVELKARLGVGRRVVESSIHVLQLQGLLPICAACKKVRDTEDYWHHVEDYISKRSSAQFTHSICPDCIKKLYPDLESKTKQ